jgi:hypothetical protein
MGDDFQQWFFSRKEEKEFWKKWVYKQKVIKKYEAEKEIREAGTMLWLKSAKMTEDEGQRKLPIAPLFRDDINQVVGEHFPERFASLPENERKKIVKQILIHSADYLLQIGLPYACDRHRHMYYYVPERKVETPVVHRILEGLGYPRIAPISVDTEEKWGFALLESWVD